jgi:hypothetical protein
MTKYKEYFDKMVSENKDAFDKFTSAHFEYSIDQDKNQEAFNKVGEDILKIIHEWEDRLCKHSEGAGFGKYTSNLSEKFQAEIKSHFPLIDHIGIVVSKPKASFNLKKITPRELPKKFSLKKIKL